MSPIVRISTKVRDPSAVAAACRRLGLADPVHGKADLYEGEATGLIIRFPGWEFPAVIDTELRKYLPFLATTKFLVAAVKAGTGREQAHEVIKTHAVAYALALREKPDGADDLPSRLGGDDRFPLSEAEIRALLSEPLDFVGDARRQTATFVARVGEVVARHPQAATFDTPEIL